MRGVASAAECRPPKVLLPQEEPLLDPCSTLTPGSPASDRVLSLGLPPAAGKEPDDPGAGSAAQDPLAMPVDAVHSG